MTLEAKEKRLKHARIILLFWTLFIGLGALGGGLCMIIKPDGSILQMGEMLPYFQVLPFSEYLFQDFLFSGISLIVVNGLSNMVATFFILKKKRVGYLLGMIFGFTLMLWIIIQFVIFPPFFIDDLYFGFGLAQMITGICALVFYQQTQFAFDSSSYEINNEDSKTLVIYFSRMGYAKKVAYEIAEEKKACLLELTTDEPVKNTSGFWWCGFLAMRRKTMTINDLKLDLSTFNQIMIVTPIWVWGICAPIRDFVRKNLEMLQKKNTTVIYVHFSSIGRKAIRKDIEKEIGPCKIGSYSSKLGKIIKE